jgi:hypothetical protein
MHEVNGIFADHHKYVIDGVIDADVVATQSRKQADKGEAVYVHWHKFNEDCTDKHHETYGPCRTRVNNDVV